jgi:hypothetical protein
MYTGINNFGLDTLTALVPNCTYARFTNLQAGVVQTWIAYRPGLTVIVLEGTTQIQQWVGQIISGSVGLVNQGPYSTLLYWQQQCSVIMSYLRRLTVDPDGAFVVVGHSMGGAVGCLVAAALRIARFERPISLLTFGCPKPGDFRLRLILDATPQIHFVNTSDPIPFIPPSGVEFNGLAYLVPPTVFRSWLAWERPAPRTGLTRDGQRFANPSDFSIYALMFETVLNVSLGRLPPVFYRHNTAEYYQSVICPDDVVHYQLVSTGGGMSDGTTVFSVGRHLVSTGGGMSDGTTYFYHAHFLVSTGGGMSDGTTVFSVGRHLVSTGGGMSDGATVFSVGRHLVSTGGGMSDGATVFSVGRYLVSTGGGMSDGTTVFSVGRYLVSTGGGMSDGTTFYLVSRHLVSIGGGMSDGQALPYHYHLLSTGGGMSDGTTYLSVGRDLVSRGGGMSDGTTYLSVGRDLVSRGGGMSDGTTYLSVGRDLVSRGGGMSDGTTIGGYGFHLHSTGGGMSDGQALNISFQLVSTGGGMSDGTAY